MPDTDKQELLARLEEGCKALAEALAGVDDRMAVRKPAQEAWSILECAEHVVLAEEFLLSRLQAARAAAPATPNSAREGLILKRAADRTARAESPEAARPCGRYGNLEDALAGFAAARERTVEWLVGHAGDLRSLVADHPLIPVPVTCYEMLLILAVHPRRHAGQIKAIRMGDRTFIEDNAASRQELAALISRLDERRLQCAVGSGWTLATLLCHLAFWDRLALSRLKEWESGQFGTARLSSQAIDSINEAVRAVSQAVPGSEAARLALDSAAAVDLRVEGIGDDLRARIVDAGFERLLRRSLHRREHLRKIEEALG